MASAPLRVAIVHDWLTGMRGGEAVLDAMAEVFPSAILHSLIAFPEKLSPRLQAMKIEVSWLQRVPGIERFYRHFLPLMPLAIESLNLGEYDLILSSSHCVAKGVRKRIDAVHVSYVYAPMRYMWFRFEEYFGKGVASPWVRFAARLFQPFLQSWDRASAQSEQTDELVVLSHFIQERVRDHYGRRSRVVFPFADVKRFSIQRRPESRYLIAGAWVPYKRFDLAIRACNDLGVCLVVMGAGPEEARLRAMAGPTIEFVSSPNDERWVQEFARAQALLFPGEEDFGIVPVEAMATGMPVIAYASGGLLDTVTEETGVFFNSQTAEGLCSAIRAFEARRDRGDFSEEKIRARAGEFTRTRFQRDWVAAVRDAWKSRGKDPALLEEALGPFSKI